MANMITRSVTCNLKLYIKINNIFLYKPFTFHVPYKTNGANTTYNNNYHRNIWVAQCNYVVVAIIYFRCFLYSANNSSTYKRQRHSRIASKQDTADAIFIYDQKRDKTTKICSRTARASVRSCSQRAANAHNDMRGGINKRPRFMIVFSMMICSHVAMIIVCLKILFFKFFGYFYYPKSPKYVFRRKSIYIVNT